MLALVNARRQGMRDGPSAVRFGNAAPYPRSTPSALLATSATTRLGVSRPRHGRRRERAAQPGGAAPHWGCEDPTVDAPASVHPRVRSEEHTAELQSREN